MTDEADKAKARGLACPERPMAAELIRERSMNEEQAWEFLRKWLLDSGGHAQLSIERKETGFRVSAYLPDENQWVWSEHATLAGPIVEVTSKVQRRGIGR